MSLIQNLISRIGTVFSGSDLSNKQMPQEMASDTASSSEKGYRATPEDQIKYAYRLMWVDPDLRRAILDIREMSKLDGRVKRIHNRVARDVIKGGLVFLQAQEDESISELWESFCCNLQLENVQKLKSDALGLISEGNLPMQWVLDKDFNVVSSVRMPSETILPNVSQSGRFKDVTQAYKQFDIMTGAEIAVFPLWQLTLGRYDPDNFDDLGSMGRPLLDANRKTWRKLTMTEEDLVIRRRMRAPLRLAHVLKNASEPELDAYRLRVEKDKNEITTDYYLNKEGSVTAVQGDSNLDQMADIVHLLDTFFAGTPLPKGLMGYTDGMARDILQDLTNDYFDEVDVLQDTLSYVYNQGFRLHLMLKGLNPDAFDYTITFKERRTETLTQTTDRGLKLKALGLPEGMVWEEMGFDPEYVRQRKEWEKKNYDPYPDSPDLNPNSQTVNIVPGNAPKGDSATTITNS